MMMMMMNTPILLFILLCFCCHGVENRVYIYDLPAELNTEWSEVAFDSDDASVRNYALKGDGWAKTETILHQQLLQSSLRIQDVDNQDDEQIFYLVPVYTAILYHHAHGDVAAKNMETAIDHISSTKPFWNLTKGKRHIFMFMHPQGPCNLNADLQVLLHNSILLVSPIAFSPESPQCQLMKRAVSIPLFADSLVSLSPTYRLDTTAFLALVNPDAFLQSCEPNCPTSISKIRDSSDEAFAATIEAEDSTQQILEKMASSRYCWIVDALVASQAISMSVAVGCLPVVSKKAQNRLPFANVVSYDKFVTFVDDGADIGKIMAKLRKVEAAAIEKMEMEMKVAADMLSYKMESPNLLSTLHEALISSLNKPKKATKKTRASSMLDNYASFHQSAINGSDSNIQYVVWMEDQEQGIEGVIQGFVSSLVFAMMTNRALIIRKSTTPRISYLFEPNTIQYSSDAIETKIQNLRGNTLEFTKRTRKNIELLVCAPVDTESDHSTAIFMDFNVIPILAANVFVKHKMAELETSIVKANANHLSMYSTLFRYLMKPSKRVMERVEKIYSRLRAGHNAKLIGLHIKGPVSPITEAMVRGMTLCADYAGQIVDDNMQSFRIVLTADSERWTSLIKSTADHAVAVVSLLGKEAKTWKWEWSEGPLVELLVLSKLDGLVLPESSHWDLSAALGNHRSFIFGSADGRCVQNVHSNPNIDNIRGMVASAECLQSSPAFFTPTSASSRFGCLDYPKWKGKTSFEVFESFVTDTWEKVHSLKINFAALKSTNKAVLVMEHGKSKQLSYTVRNTMHFLGPSWGLVVYHLENNEEYIKEQLESTKHPNIDFRSLTHYNYTTQLSWIEYNSLLLRKEFWEEFDQEHILILHTDALMLRHNDLSRWLKFDFVGSPWDWCQEDWCKGGGNGGMSIRSKTAMIRVLSQPLQQTYAEDQLFTRELFNLHGNLPSQMEAAAFSVETMKSEEEPAATHAFWKHNSPYETYKLLSAIDYN